MFCNVCRRAQIGERLSTKLGEQADAEEIVDAKEMLGMNPNLEHANTCAWMKREPVG